MRSLVGRREGRRGVDRVPRVAPCGTGLHSDNIEQAVTNELFQNERHTAAGCVFNVTPEDTSNILNGNKSSPNFGTTIGTVSETSILQPYGSRTLGSSRQERSSDFLGQSRKSFSEGVRHRPRVQPSHPVPKAGKAVGEMTGLGGGLAAHARKSLIAECAENRRRERGVARRRPRLPARLGCGWPECS